MCDYVTNGYSLSWSNLSYPVMTFKQVPFSKLGSIFNMKEHLGHYTVDYNAISEAHGIAV